MAIQSDIMENIKNNKECQQCKKTFTKKANESKHYWATKRFCSVPCAREQESHLANKDLPTKICELCSSEFKKTTKLSQKQWDAQRLCSRECVYQDEVRNNKIGEWSKGNAYGFVKGFEPWNKGKSGLYALSEETKRKISEALKGEKSYLWKGGITPLNLQIRGCQKMRDWKRAVLKRDDYTCQECGERGGKLNADHIKEFSLIREENNIQNLQEAEVCAELWDLENGQTLCNDCHREKTRAFMKENWSNQFTNTDTWQLI